MKNTPIQDKNKLNVPSQNGKLATTPNNANIKPTSAKSNSKEKTKQTNITANKGKNNKNIVETVEEVIIPPPERESILFKY